MNEQWKTVPDYPNYMVSNTGKVKHKDSDQVRTPVYRNGYTDVVLFDDTKRGKRKGFQIHRLVAELFCPNDDPENKTQVNHINGKKDDNRACNLEWTTREGNMNHVVENGLSLKKLTLEDKEEIKRLSENGWSAREIAKVFNICHQTVSYHLKKMGVEAKIGYPKGRPNGTKTERIKKLYNDGLTVKEISQYMKMDPQNIYYHLKKDGINRYDRNN